MILEERRDIVVHREDVEMAKAKAKVEKWEKAQANKVKKAAAKAVREAKARQEALKRAV